MFKGNSVKSFVKSLGTNKHAGSSTFAILNIEKVKAKFRLEQEAIKRGKENLPPKSAKSFDDIEQNIISFIDSEVNQAVESYHDNMSSFQQRINYLHGSGHVGTIEGVAMRAEGDFAAIVKRDVINLHIAKDEVTHKEADLLQFKEDNNLKRSARYPDSRAIYFAVAFMLILIETVVNGYFFAKGHEMGLLGGGFVALIPSFLNVMTGFLLGNYACRLAVHRGWSKKIVGAILCVSLPLWVFGLNLFVAHYRAAMVGMIDGGITDAAKFAHETFMSAPFGLDDFESWLLLIVGCVCALIATLDFWRMDDAYLGYGKIAREHAKKLDGYASLTSESLDELSKCLDGSLEELEEASNLLNAKVNEANTIVNAQNRWKVLFDQHLNYLEDSGRQLLAYYRNHNIVSRTESAPKYFDNEWHITKPKLSESGIDFEVILTGFQNEAGNVRDIYSACLQRITDAYNNALASYPSINELKPEEKEACPEEEKTIAPKRIQAVA